MRQLHMIRPAQPVKIHPLPDGYRYVGFTGSAEEIADWLVICREGLLAPDAGEESYESLILQYPDVQATRDLFFVSAPDGKRIATLTAVSRADGRGYIHMVGAMPVVRGKGIGHAMLSRGLEMLCQRTASESMPDGPEILLTTDDFRLAAIKTYLDAGFLPVLVSDPESDMRTRWDAVFSALHYPPVPFLPGERW